MFEKVNPSHPDKLADRIAGAIVDYCYTKEKSPRVAVEVLLGHGKCHIIAETSVAVPRETADKIVARIVGPEVLTELVSVPQDPHLASNQQREIRCGDNGIFKGVPVTKEQKALTALAQYIYEKFPTDGKYIKDGDKIIICQSNAEEADLSAFAPSGIINPLGPWTGGPDVDTGATNRKLGSDMGDGVTGGGLHGKDLSKADVSVNIWCHLKAQQTGHSVTACCAIGDDNINGIPYSEIVEEAGRYIKAVGGFEKFAEWGLIR